VTDEATARLAVAARARALHRWRCRQAGAADPDGATALDVAETKGPDVKVPDAAVPDAAVPDVPDAAGPDDTTPEVTLPASSETVAGLTLVALQGATVAPQTRIALRLELAPGVAAPARVDWSVEQPSGSQSFFEPSTDPLQATFEANIIGGYRFAAFAYASDGRSIATLNLLVSVVPGPGLHIQLSWRTPGDVNEGDNGGDPIYFSVGSDVDLHLLHPKANGKFFDFSYDCYWENTNPEWGIFDPSDNAQLDRDDTDGGGPEIIALTSPEADATYTIGVHYWNDWGYGKAFATLRIYLDGALMDEWADVELDNDDLWMSHEFENGVLTRVGEPTPSITRNYRAIPRISSDLQIVSDQGTVVTPGTDLDLRIAGAPGSTLPTSAEWTVASPTGSLTALQVDPSMLRARLRADIVGIYRVSVLMKDAALVEYTASLDITVAATLNVRVQLLWRTPGDPDETDSGGTKGASVGSDLDLHLLHPGALGEYFDSRYDCSWETEDPEWGSFSPADNPSHQGDDIDGAGPEYCSRPQALRRDVYLPASCATSRAT